ncbi:MAG: type III-B CRISPR module RAMP protein Cmr6 [Helicobacteraceae bacterium]|jgi:CRISPR-associated protein Cmr6|nr:type III-B CRISPR module RAMP protein Cmr6 [Helicobacteraceae bacterium]
MAKEEWQDSLKAKIRIVKTGHNDHPSAAKKNAAPSQSSGAKQDGRDSKGKRNSDAQPRNDSRSERADNNKQSGGGLNLQNANAGWLFWRYMTHDPNNGEAVKKAANQLLNLHISPSANNEKSLPQRLGFELITTYPGMLLGSGYAHDFKESGDGNANFKLGFFFDHTTGEPIIAGSSIKGVLRSVFPSRVLKGYQDASREWIRELLRDDAADIDALESEIFEGARAGIIGAPESDDLDRGKQISLYERDRFLDARLASGGDKVFADDYITPHGDELKNPTPLRFLKVAGRVKFAFSFILNDGVITAKQKLDLFKTIITTLGVGAKTNVGYGKLETA